MVGVIRNEKFKQDKIYERKVRFEPEIDASNSATPLKEFPPAVVAAAEFHRLEKRRSASVSRLSFGKLNISGPRLNDYDKSSPRYPTTPVRRRTRHTRPYAHPVQSKKFELRPCSFEDFPSSPTKIADSDSYSRGFSCFDMSSASEGMFRRESKSSARRCAQLEQENYDLRIKNEELERRNSELWTAIENMRDHMSRNGITPPAGLTYDADTELDLFDHTQASASVSTFNPGKIVSPAASLTGSAPTSSLPSPTMAEAGSPIGSPAMPIRIIDEDYDGDLNASTVKADQDQIRSSLSFHSGGYTASSMEHAMEMLAIDLDEQMKLGDHIRFDNLTTQFIRDIDYSLF